MEASAVKPDGISLGRFSERYRTYAAGRELDDLSACAHLAVGFLLASDLCGGAAALALLLDREFPDNGSPWGPPQ